MKTKFITFASIIFLPSVLGLIYNFISPFGLSLFESNKKFSSSAENILSGIKAKNLGNDIFSVSSKDARMLTDEYKPIFIDARDPWEYSKKRIINSINIPQFSFDSKNPKLLGLKKENLFIIYCSSEDCDLSLQLARELKRINFKSLLIIEDGIEGWIKNKYPLEGCEQ
jgi:rhodanese-related sulfurtransferase